MAIPNPNPNIVDGYPCDNKTYSSNKIESLITMATELPVPAAGDAGKVLTVNAAGTGYELDAIPTEVPTPEAGDAGKMLKVNSAETGYELISDPSNVVQIQASDFFNEEDLTKIDEFYAYRVGKIVFIERLKIKSVSIASPDYQILDVKSEYKPLANLRILGQYEAVGADQNEPIRTFFSPVYGFGTENYGTFVSIWIYSFAYVIA